MHAKVVPLQNLNKHFTSLTENKSSFQNMSGNKIDKSKVSIGIMVLEY